MQNYKKENGVSSHGLKTDGFPRRKFYEENIQKLFTWHKKMKYLSNAFSLQMLDTQSINTMRFEPISIEEVKKQDFVSVVGHADLANILSGMLEKEVKMNKSYLHL